MLSSLGKRFVDALKAVKATVMSLPALLRNINSKRSELQELLDRANSFTSLLAVSSNQISESSSVIRYDVSAEEEYDKSENPNGRMYKEDKIPAILPSFNTPNRKEIYDNSKLADDIEAAMNYINATVEQLRLFPSDKLAKAEIKNLLALKAEFNEKMNDIINIIGEFYDKHVPDMYENVLRHALRQMNSILPDGSYKKMMIVDQTITSHDTFAGKHDAAIEFTSFIELAGLNEEKFKSSDLYVAITGVVHEVKTSVGALNTAKSEQLTRKLADTKLPERLIELVRERSAALRKNHNRVVLTKVEAIKEVLATTDSKFAKLIQRFETAQSNGRDTESIETKIDEALLDVYGKVALLDADTGTTSSAYEDAVYKKLVSKREAARKRKAKSEVILAFDKEIEDHLVAKIAERNAKRDKAAKAPRNSKVHYHMAFYVTTLTRVRGPGMFDPGTEITGATVEAIKRNLTKELRLQLAVFSSSPIIGKLPIGKTTQELRHSPLGNVPGVSDIRVVDDIIEITTGTKREDVIDSTIIPDVLLALNSMYRTNRQTRFFVAKEMRGGSKGIILKATYVKS